MEETLEIYSSNEKNFTIDKNLDVLVDIKKNKYNIPSEFLFKMAARKNLKREFLFVSKVIGKHLPMNPQALNIIGGLLARSWVEERENTFFQDTEVLVEAINYLQEKEFGEKIDESDLAEAISILKKPIELKSKTLFIGFAETATGISHAVFNSCTNATFIHTTRENIKSIKPSVLFEEEHSHAVEQQLYPLNPSIFEEFDDIVLIDDELTTGKTALNLINKIKGKNFGVIAILDWRESEQEVLYENNQGKNIKVCSLIKGTIRHEKKGKLDFADKIEELVEKEPISFKDIRFRSGNYIEGYLMETGRFGCSSNMHRDFFKEISKIALDLKKLRVDGNCLCVGTEEFIYIPCVISSEMGKNIYFQSTTRSPIYAKNISHYGINRKIAFKSHEDIDIQKYLYNIPSDYYNQVFMFSEKPLEESKRKEFAHIFSNYNITNVVFVSFENSQEVEKSI